MGKYDVKVSNYHKHKSGDRGWDINIKDEKGNTEHKMHVDSYSEEGDSEGKGILESMVGAIASLFNK